MIPIRLKRAIVRVANLNEQLAFELKHVPDGAYVLALESRCDRCTGKQCCQLGAFVGINPFTGEVDPGALIQVVNGASVTDLQIMLQPRNRNLLKFDEVSVQSVDVENEFVFHPTRWSTGERGCLTGSDDYP